MAYLIAASGHSVQLAPKPTIVGSDARADLPIQGLPGVHPQHFALIPHEGRHWVQAASPQAVVLVNGVPVESACLKEGDVIQAGELMVQFRVTLPGTPVHAPSAPQPQPQPQHQAPQAQPTAQPTAQPYQQAHAAYTQPAIPPQRSNPPAQAQAHGQQMAALADQAQAGLRGATAVAADLRGQAAAALPGLKGGLFKLEDAPAFGQGSMSVEDERTFALLAHPFALIIWLWKRKESPVVEAHGREALNFGLTLFIVIFALSIVVSLLGTMLGTTIIQLYSLVMGVLNLGLLALVIFAGIKAREGKLLRYPFAFRFIKA